MMGKSPHVLCAGNDGEGKSGSEGGTGARKDPAGRREKRLRVPRAQGAGGEHGSSLRSPCNRDPRREPRPREPGQPPQKGVARSASPRGTAQRGARGQDEAAAAPRPPQVGGNAAIPGHGDTGTQEQRAPSPERGGAPATNTRREQDGDRGRKERRTERKEASHHVRAPTRPRIGGSAHSYLHGGGAGRARPPGTCSLQGATVTGVPGQGVMPGDPNSGRGASKLVITRSVPLSKTSLTRCACGRFCLPYSRETPESSATKGLFGKEKINQEPPPSHRCPLPSG